MINRNKHLRKIIALSLAGFGISCLIFISDIFKGFELKAYDLLSRSVNPQSSSKDIVIVKIDQPSIDSLSAAGNNWPWPRQIYAPIIDYLSEANVVFMDIFFLEPSSYGEQDDQIFADAVKKASNVYIALSLTDKKDTINNEDREFLERISLKGMLVTGPSFRSVNLPLDILLPAVRGAGNVTIPPDEDGVYRRMPLLFRLGGDYTIPCLVLDYLIRENKITYHDEKLFAGEKPIPLFADNLLLRYSRNPEPFESISAADILKASVDSEASGGPSIRREYFRGKKVFIGLTAAGLLDLKPTSVSAISTGVQIHAAALQNILHRNFISPLHPVYAIGFMLLISFCTSYTVIRYNRFFTNLSFFILFLFITIAGPAALFANAFYLQIIYPSLSLITSFILAVAYSYATEGRERRFIKTVFAQYMDKKIVNYVLGNPELIKPGGQRKRVTVFFADIAGFTSLAEKIPPEETARILHSVLNAFTEVIIENEGVIDKYIGDAIMAFWGAPLGTDRDDIHACSAALQCLEALEEINRGFRAAGMPEIAIRIGIHSGDAIVGNLGSDRLFDYTVVGDTVNLTSRLEAASKIFRTKIIISEETLKGTEDLFLARELGLIEVKGKSLPVRIFELIGLKNNISEEKNAPVASFHAGLLLFNDGKLREALAVFSEILSTGFDDGPSAFYRKKCEALLSETGLTEGWNIIKMTEK